MRIATFNANSVRARLPIIMDWLSEKAPEILVIQETKVADPQFPIEAFRNAGWNVAFHGQKSYNGVAIVSRLPIEEPQMGFCDPEYPDDCRVLTAEIGGVRIINTYVPNGSAVGTDKFEYKLRWLERFRRFLDERYALGEKVVWLGDMNVAPTSDDVYNPKRYYGKVGHHPDEMERLAKLVDWGMTDVFRKFHQGPGHYTFWDFFIPNGVERNLGWRIDHIYASPSMAEACAHAEVDIAPRLKERPSDHTFVLADFDL